MRLTIKPYNCAGGADFVIECDDSSKVQDIKRVIGEKFTDLPPETQKLVYRGKILENSEIAKDAGFVNGSTCL